MTAAVGFLLFLAFVLTCVVVVGWVGQRARRRLARIARPPCRTTFVLHTDPPWERRCPRTGGHRGGCSTPWAQVVPHPGYSVKYVDPRSHYP